MRLALFTFLLAASFSLLSKEEPAYLIIKSEAINSEKQPKWICLMNHGRCKHVSANKGIVEVNAGSYYVRHIDFLESIHLGHGSQNLENTQVFDVEAGNIYFIGNLLLRRKTTFRYEMGIDQDTALILAACKSSPKIFENNPLVTNNGSEKIMVNCSGIKN